jgi:hypothetical protein
MRKDFFKLDSRGQAALMDSIIFLTIVASITTGMFFFTINYGTQTADRVNSFYSSDFAVDALKVITYINVLRTGEDFGRITSMGVVELDYLLALIKEDYADTKTLSPETTNAVVATLGATMRPFDRAYDYAFYLVTVSEPKNFLFVVLALHECTSYPSVCADPTDKTKEIDRVFYYCTPGISNFLEKDVFPRVGKVDSGYGKVTLSEDVGTRSESRIYIMGLQTWKARNVSTLTDLDDPANPLTCRQIIIPTP